MELEAPVTRAEEPVDTIPETVSPETVSPETMAVTQDDAALSSNSELLVGTGEPSDISWGGLLVLFGLLCGLMLAVMAVPLYFFLEQQKIESQRKVLRKHVKSADYQNARAAFEKLKRMDASARWTKFVRGKDADRMAKVILKQKYSSIKEGLAKIDEALKISPSSSVVNLEKARRLMIHAEALRRKADLKGFESVLGQAEVICKGLSSSYAHGQSANYTLARISTLQRQPWSVQKTRYRVVMQTHSSSWMGLMSLALINFNEGQLERALKYAAAALVKNKRCQEALLLSAEVLRRQHEYSKAATDLERVFELDPESSRAFALRAQLRYQQEDLEGCLRDVEHCLKLDKTWAMAFALRAAVFLKQKKLKECVHDCERALKIDMRCGFAYLIRGQALLEDKDGDKGKAQKDIWRAVKHAPQDAESHYWSGKLSQIKGDRRAALESYTLCLKFDPKHVAAYANRGTIYRLMKSYEAAIRDTDMALQLQPKNAQVWLQRVKIQWAMLRKQGKPYTDSGWDKVLEGLSNALIYNPNLSGAYGRRSFLHRRRKDYNKAMADLQRAIDVDDEDVWVWRGYKGLLHVEIKQYRPALEELKFYISKAPSNHTIYNSVRRAILKCQRELEQQ